MTKRAWPKGEAPHPALAALVHPDKDVRQRAAVAIGQRSDPTLAPAIAELLWDEPDFFVRETLTWVLTRTPATAVEAAIDALHDTEVGVRLQALHLLSKLADPDSSAKVAKHIDDPNPVVADKARWALARIGDPSAIPLLVQQLGATDLTTRDSMTNTLSQFGTPAVPTVAAALHHADPSVRAHAADVLCYIGSPAHEAIPPLTHGLYDDHPDVRLACALALRELIRHPDAHSALLSAASAHDDARVRAVARATV